MGILAADGNITLDAIYDTIIPKQRLNWENDYTKVPRTNFFYRKNGKYGLISHQGKVLSEAIFDEYFRADYAKKPNYILSKDLAVFYVDFDKDTLVLEKMTLLSTHDTLLIYKFKEEYFPFFTSKKNPKKIKSIHLEYPGNKLLGKFFIVNINEKVQIFTSDGKAWSKNKIIKIENYNGKRAIVNSKGNKKGVLDLFSGKLIIDTLYSNLYLNNYANNFVWAEIEIGKEKIYYKDLQNSSNNMIFTWNQNTNKDYYVSPKNKWIILDSIGNKKSKNKFDEINSTADTCMMYYNKLAGIIDAKYNWLIPANYKAISQITKDYFAIYTKGNKFGILNLNNKLILDTIYTDFEMIYAGNYSHWKHYKVANSDQSSSIIWFLFKNKNQEILMSNYGHKLDSRTQGDKEKIKLKLMNFAFESHKNGSPEAFRIQVSDSILIKLNSDLTSESFQKFKMAIYDTMRKVYEQNRPENFKRLTKIGLNSLVLNGRIYSLHFEVINIGQKFVSYSETIGNSMLDETPFDFYKENKIPFTGNKKFIWSQEKLIPITLDSLFGKGDLFQQEVLLAIQARTDLDLDCSSLEKLAEKFSHTFSLSEKGIVLYHYDMSHGYYQNIKLLIPLERLKINKKTAWIIEYLKQ